MLSKLIVASCIATALVFIACGHSSETARTTTPPPGITSPDSGFIPPPPPMPPNVIEITATIVGADTGWKSTRPPNSTEDYPCGLVIRIDSVRGYGPAVTMPIAVGDKLPVSFLGPPAPKLLTPAEIRANPNPPLPPQVKLAAGMVIQGRVLRLAENKPVIWQMVGYSLVR